MDGEGAAALISSVQQALGHPLWRAHNITETTFYRWRTKFGGMEVSEAKRLKDLERENAELKRMVAEQALDIRC